MKGIASEREYSAKEIKALVGACHSAPAAERAEDVPR
jgi:hypothetical protein